MGLKSDLDAKTIKKQAFCSLLHSNAFHFSKLKVCLLVGPFK